MSDEAWPGTTVGRDFDVRIGGTPAREVQSYWAGQGQEGHPWVSIADLRGRREIVATSERITDLGVANSNAKLIPAGTPLVSFKLTIGTVSVAGVDLFTNEAIAAITPRCNGWDMSYVTHVLAPLFKSSASADRAIKGATLNKQKILALRLAKPPIEEQRGIARVLDTADEAIEKTERLIQHLQQAKTGMLHDLLTRGVDEHGQLRDPEAHPERFHETPDGMLPRSWRVLTLDDVAGGSRNGVVDGPFGSNLKSSHYRETGIPVIQGGYVAGGYFKAPETYKYVDEATFHELRRSAVEGRDMVMVKKGSAGANAMLPAGHPRSLLASNVLKISPDPNVCLPEFLAVTLGRWYAVGGVRDILESTGIPAINLRNLKRVRVVLPPLEEQERINAALVDANHRIIQEQAFANQLRLAKSGILDDLLSGRIRVSEAVTA